jgi:predicted metal-dependent hydrolase
VKKIKNKLTVERLVTNSEIGMPYVLRTSARAKRVRIVVEHDGQVVVTRPRRVSERVAQEFALSQRKWIAKRLEKLAVTTEGLSIDLRRNDQAHFIEYKKQALELAKQKVAELNAAHYGFGYKSVRVKQMKTQWGSCSAKRNLNFNYKILFLPPELQDYLLVHELCHLKEMNHSPRFWRLVEKAVPDYLRLRKELRQLV